MDRQIRSWIIAGICFSLFINLFLVVAFVVMRPVREAVGQTAEGGEGLMLGTEKTAESPVCFILDPKSKHLVAYKLDTAGCLQLVSSRDINYDLKLPDSHFPNGQAQGRKTTLPPVDAIQKAITKGAAKAPKEEKE